MRRPSFISNLISKARNAAEQLYSPVELRALILFLLLGIAVLVARGGRSVYDWYYPAHRDTSEQHAIQKRDSVFLALSTKARVQDSLIFSLPEDSLVPHKTESASYVYKKQPLAHSIALNLASKAELLNLPTVGSATADLILQYRRERSGFRSLHELKNVRGIGEKRFDRMKEYLRLN